MEKRIKNKIDTHQVAFKENIKDWIEKNKLFINEDMQSDFLKYIYDYEHLTITQTDLQKRKRSKNIVPQFDRCSACRANGEQCTRRKMENKMFCGTHIKSTPNGVVNHADDTATEKNKKVTVWYEDIVGIQYYIDEDNNVYRPEDIMSNKLNPDIIGTWEKNSRNEYSIPNLGINV
tara:strand:- start:1866 stop:2393 length:528 start_codon:yes stop_codon:yes gene_type:complete